MNYLPRHNIEGFFYYNCIGCDATLIGLNPKVCDSCVKKFQACSHCDGVGTTPIKQSKLGMPCGFCLCTRINLGHEQREKLRAEEDHRRHSRHLKDARELIARAEPAVKDLEERHPWLKE